MEVFRPAYMRLCTATFHGRPQEFSRAKILGNFSRKQHMTSSFPNSRGGVQLPQVAHLRAPMPPHIHTALHHAPCHTDDLDCCRLTSTSLWYASFIPAAPQTRAAGLNSTLKTGVSFQVKELSAIRTFAVYSSQCSCARRMIEC